MLSMREGVQAMVDRRDRVAGAFDDDVDRRVRHQGAPVLANMGRPGRNCSVERGGLRLLRAPAYAR